MKKHTQYQADQFTDKIRALVADVIRYYKENKKRNHFPSNVHRGRAGSIADRFEDRFAIFLSEVLSERYTFLVNCSMSWERKKLPVYPDIIIVGNKNVVAGLIELKIDVGWLTDGWFDSFDKKLLALRSLTETKISSTVADAAKVQNPLRICSSFSSAIIMLSAKNEHRERFQNFDRRGDCFVILREHHPNHEQIRSGYPKIEAKRLIADGNSDIVKLHSYLKENYEFK